MKKPFTVSELLRAGFKVVMLGGQTVMIYCLIIKLFSELYISVRWTNRSYLNYYDFIASQHKTTKTLCACVREFQTSSASSLVADPRTLRSACDSCAAGTRHFTFVIRLTRISLLGDESSLMPTNEDNWFPVIKNTGTSRMPRGSSMCQYQYLK
jgi:hypothetical protein